MSGVKYSEYRIVNTEQVQRAYYQNALAALEQSRANLQAQLEAQLQNASSGLKESFPQATSQAQTWLAIARQQWSEVESSANLSALGQAVSQNQAIINQGQQAVNAVLVAFNQQATAIGQALNQQLADLETAFYSGQPLLAHWRETKEVNQWAERISLYRGQLNNQQYGLLQASLPSALQELTQQIEETQQWEADEQKRAYFVDSFRQVIENMGLKEVSGPVYERKGDRRSRLIYRVDGLGHGQLVFYISLDGNVRSESSILEEYCFAGFGQISEDLRRLYSIEATFRTEDGQPLRKERTAQGLPQSIARTRTISH